MARLIEVFTDHRVSKGVVTIPMPDGGIVPQGAHHIEIRTEKKRGSAAFHADFEGPHDIVAPALMLVPFGAVNFPVNLGSNYDSVTTIYYAGADIIDGAQTKPVGYTVESNSLEPARVLETFTSAYGNRRRLGEDNVELLDNLERIAQLFRDRGGFAGAST